MNSKVSVIIPMYNSEKYIEKCINSVIEQTYNNIEILIINDCSTDSSLNIVKNIKDERIKVITFTENKGVSIARNEGINLATGDYICFIDSDDFWVKEKIEKQLEFIEKNNYEFIYSNYSFFRNEKILKTTHVPLKLTYEQAIKNTTIFISTVMLDMKKLKKEDLYMPNLKIGQDTSVWWKILKKGVTAYGMDEVLTYYRVSNKSLSSNKIKAVLGAWKIYLREDMNFFKRLYCFMCYIKNAIDRRI